MFALALLAVAIAQQGLFLAPAGYVPVQQAPVLVNPAMTAPAQSYHARASEPVMIVDQSGFVVSNMPSPTLIAASASDFGGYTIPIIGLVILAATIGLLAGPVDED